MALGICKAVEIMITEIQLGIKCFLIIHDGFAPVVLADKTYSCSFKDKICPLIKRDIDTQYNRANTINNEMILEPIFSSIVPSIIVERFVCFKTDAKRITINISGSE